MLRQSFTRFAWSTTSSHYDWETFDARTYPPFADEDLITAMFARQTVVCVSADFDGTSLRRFVRAETPLIDG
jgi:hypothetical protein